MLSFLSPLFLIGAAAAVVPIVLHLLKRQPEVRVRFAAVKLLRTAPVEHTARRRLRELWLLALRVAALILLAVAFARPFLGDAGPVKASGLTVVALDTSLSLSAPGQLARAREVARSAIGRAPDDHLVAVVTFADTARVAVAPTADRTLAVSAVDRAETEYGSTRYRAALTTAADLIASFGQGSDNAIVIVTDLQARGWGRGDRVSVPESVRIEVADVGPPPPNLALTGLRPAPGDRLVATVRNFGPATREARLLLTVDGRPAGDAASTLGPGESAEVALDGVRGVAASVSLEDREGVQADNVRYVVLGSSTRPAVLFVTAGGDLAREAFYSREALTAPGSGGPTLQAEGVAASQLAAWTGTRLDRYSAVVMLSTRGLERHGRELLTDYLRRGGGLMLAVGPGIDGEVAAEAFGPLVSVVVPPAAAPKDPRGGERALVPVDARHPVFRAFGGGRTALGLVTFERVATIGGADCQTLARFTTGELALVECSSGDGRGLVFASDLEGLWNDFPLHETFVPFLHEAVRYLAGERTSRVGEYLIGEAPAGVPREPGVVTLPDTPAGPGRRVAVNVDPSESDPARVSPDEFQAAVTRLKDTPFAPGQVEARDREERQRLWQYVLLMMAGVLAFESFVSTRTT